MKSFNQISNPMTKKVELSFDNEAGVIYVTGKRNGVTIEDWVHKGEDVQEVIDRVVDQFYPTEESNIFTKR